MKVNDKELASMWWNLANIIRGSGLDSERAFSVLTVLLALKFLIDNQDHLDVQIDVSFNQVFSSGVSAMKIMEAANEIENYNLKLEGLFSGLNLDREFKQLELDRVLVTLAKELERLDLSYESMADSDALNGTIARAADTWFERIAETSHGGEFATPMSVNSLAVGLLSFPLSNVYDGTAGICGNLISVAREARRLGYSIPELAGQEVNEATLSLGKINLLLHGLEGNHVLLGNTITDPKWTSNERLKQFEGITMNPPFALKVANKEQLEKDVFYRYRYGVPSAARADMAFVQHALASLTDTGKAILVQPLGTLIRGGVDEQIRRGMLEDGVIEAVIFLPRNLLFNTAISIALLVLTKNNPHPGSVLFIKADNNFEKGRRNVLRGEDIEKILTVYHECEEIEDYSRLVPMDEIVENEWNLNIARYVESVELEDSKAGPAKVSVRKYNNLNVPKVRLGDIADVDRGAGSTRNVQEADESGEYRLVNLGDINEYGKLKMENITPVSVNRKARLNELKPGDMLISSRGTPFKVAVIPEVDIPLIASDNFIVVRFRNDFEPYFLKSFLESPIGMQLLFSLQRGSAVPVLSHRDLEELEIPSLPINLQIEIADAAVKADERYLAALDSAKKAYEASYRNVYQLMNLDDAIEIEEGGTLS